MNSPNDKSLIEKEKLHFLFDTDSLQEPLKNGHREGIRLLKYQEMYFDGEPLFEFFRSSADTESQHLNSLRKCSDLESSGCMVLQEEGNLLSEIGEKLGKLPTSLDDYYYNYMRELEPTILVTQNKHILERRQQLESRRRGYTLKVMTLEEAFEFLGLFLRYNDEARLGPKYGISSPSGWYWNLFRYYVPHFEVQGRYVKGLGEKFEYLLYSLDQVAYSQKRNADNSTQIELFYHFNYGLSLISSIFDLLALQTRDNLSIEEDDQVVSIDTGRNHNIVDEIKEENEDLKEVLDRNMSFIRLINEARNLIIHKDGFSRVRYQERGWSANMINLDRTEDKEDFMKHLNSRSSEKLPYRNITEWGYHEIYEEDQIDSPSQIEPYQFLKRATEELTRFVDAYLEALGYNNYIEEAGESNSIKNDAQNIDKHGLVPFFN